MVDRLDDGMYYYPSIHVGWNCPAHTKLLFNGSSDKKNYGYFCFLKNGGHGTTEEKDWSSYLVFFDIASCGFDESDIIAESLYEEARDMKNLGITINLEEDNMKTKKLYKVYAVDTKNEEILVDGNSYIAETKEEVKAKVSDHLIRMHGNLSSNDLIIEIEKKAFWVIEDECCGGKS